MLCTFRIVAHDIILKTVAFCVFAVRTEQQSAKFHRLHVANLFIRHATDATIAVLLSTLMGETHHQRGLIYRRSTEPPPSSAFSSGWVKRYREEALTVSLTVDRECAQVCDCIEKHLAIVCRVQANSFSIYN